MKIFIFLIVFTHTMYAYDNNDLSCREDNFSTPSIECTPGDVFRANLTSIDPIRDANRFKFMQLNPEWKPYVTSDYIIELYNPYDDEYFIKD